MKDRLTVGFFVDRVLEDETERFRYDEKIGFYVNNLSNDFAQAVCKGVMDGAVQKDVNLLLFPGRYFQPVFIDSKWLDYEYQYDHIFSFATEKNIDVLLVLMGCTGDLTRQQAKMKLVDKLRKKGLPVITLAARIDGCNSVCVDNEHGFRQGIEHLINDHGCRRLAYIGGTVGNEDAAARFEVYKLELADHGIDYDESIVRHGNFTEFCEPLVEEVLDSPEPPDAVIFANDQMALGGYNVFRRRGMVPGRDICVLGFDDAECARDLSPGLTTVRVRAEQIGQEAIDECISYQKTGQVTDRVIGSELLIRGSCGCEYQEEKKPRIHEDRDDALLNDLTQAVTRDMLLFEGHDDVSITQMLANLNRLHIKRSYVYLYGGSHTYNSDQTWMPPRFMYLKARQIGTDVMVVPENQQKIPFYQLFDNALLPRDRHSLIIMPLFLKEEQFGLFLCEVDHEYVNYLPAVSYQLSIAMKFLLMFQEQDSVQKKLQENNVVLDSISKRDELTRIYNRRGFLNAADKFMKSPVHQGRQAIAVYADLDLLKVINDRFGHDEGDFAIKTVASMLRMVFASDSIVGRFGGDEFVVLFALPEGKNWDDYQTAMEQRLQVFNQSSGKPYNVSLCMGAADFVCSSKVSISEVLAAADSALYKEKLHKIKNVIKDMK